MLRHHKPRKSGTISGTSGQLKLLHLAARFQSERGRSRRCREGHEAWPKASFEVLNTLLVVVYCAVSRLLDRLDTFPSESHVLPHFLDQDACLPVQLVRVLMTRQIVQEFQRRAIQQGAG